MVHQLNASLGSVEFDLEDWLLRLEHDPTLVIPSEDKERWRWLQTALDFDLKRLGLLRDVTPAPVGNKRVAGLVAGGEAFLKRNQG